MRAKVHHGLPRVGRGGDRIAFAQQEGAQTFTARSVVIYNEDAAKRSSGGGRPEGIGLGAYWHGWTAPSLPNQGQPACQRIHPATIVAWNRSFSAPHSSGACR